MGWPIAAFPGALIAFWHAQTAFLTSAIQSLIAGQLATKPFRAGLCIGLLVIKPHLAVLIPVALLAARIWPAIVGASLSIGATVTASWVMFGTDVWAAYPLAWEVSRSLVETGDRAFFLRQVTIYAMMMAWDLPQVAIAAQSVAAGSSVVAVWKLWSSNADINAKIAFLLALTPLATPYLFSYDLPFLIVPILWLVGNYRQPWHRPILVALYLSLIVCLVMAVLIFRTSRSSPAILAHGGRGAKIRPDLIGPELWWNTSLNSSHVIASSAFACPPHYDKPTRDPHRQGGWVRKTGAAWTIN